MSTRNRPSSRAHPSHHVDRLSSDLFKLTLTNSNKASLFASALTLFNTQESSLILSNLSTWSHSAAQHFKPRTPEVVTTTAFRLIYSDPADGALFSDDFVARQYMAVSYSWHNPSWPPDKPSSAPEPGGVWPIGKRFAEALLNLRGHPREGIWMDQICIDQCDEAEKQHAIACMDVVYKSSRRVVVLLEDVELTADEVALCRRYEDHTLPWDADRPSREEAAGLISLYEKVAAARWWQRSWCFHEFVVSEPWSTKRHHPEHNTVFVTGAGADKTHAVKWMALHSILVAVEVRLGHRSANGRHVSPILSGFEDRTSPLLDGPERRAGVARSSFMARFNAVAQTGCLMPGDKLSVCLNLVGLGLAYFRSREPSVDEVYYLAVLLALAAGEKVPLSFANTEPLVVDGKESWLARPITAADTTLPKFTLGDVRGIHSVSANRLEIDLVLFERPLQECTEAEIEGTRTVFPDVIKSTPPPLKPGMPGRPQRRSDEEMDPHRREFLAAVLAAGPGLASRLWAQLDREVVRVNYNSGMCADFVANEALRPNAAEFLNLLAGYKPEGVADAETFSPEAALAFLTWVTDPRSIYWISALTLRVSTADGDQALLTNLTLTKHFMTRGDDSQMRLAVPTDLLNGDCAWTRAWLLAPADGEETKGCWKVVAKASLLGEPDIMSKIDTCTTGNDKDRKPGVSLKTRQIIIG